MAASPLLTDLLRDVSRSFYLTLRILPGGVRPQIGLAYLLARTTDTIADTEILPLQQRLGALGVLRGRILGQSRAKLDFGELARAQGSPAERILLERCEESLSLLEATAAADKALIQRVLDVITSGQELDLQRFAEASQGRVVALRNAEELHDYTYRVAGCVGEFWTRICRAHLHPRARLDDSVLIEQGVRFGKGLQLVNILRDMPRDLRQGRCYLPSDELKQAGLTPEELLSPQNESRLRPVYDAWLGQAEGHLRAGWEYTNSLPAGQVRVRLACAWPILIGVRTLALLRQGPVLDPGHRIKISRGEVKGLILRSLFCYPIPPLWRRLGAI
jgi:farnesyl-diphosphate farnesyltransferase